MNTSIPHTSRELTITYAGQAIECGTLSVLLDAVVQQPVLVMPLSRVVPRGSLIVHQQIIHVTTRSDMHSPVYYASMRTAEVIQQTTSTTLAFPYLQRDHAMQRAQELQEEFYERVVQLITQHGPGNHLVEPARYCLPEEWIWPARCLEPRIVCRDGAWVLLDTALHPVPPTL